MSQRLWLLVNGNTNKVIAPLFWMAANVNFLEELKHENIPLRWLAGGRGGGAAYEEIK